MFFPKTLSRIFLRLRCKIGKLEIKGVSLNEMEYLIGYRFKDPLLLVQALKHRSYAYIYDEGEESSNERLEFLGDSVLNLVVTDYLYAKLPSEKEGKLSQLRSLLVSKKFLSSKAKEIGLGNYLLLSEAESASGGRQRTSILSDTMEALIGAIYLDGGFDRAEHFLRKCVLKDINRLIRDEKFVNYKSMLLEYTQGKHGKQPEYSVRSEEGPEHRKVFTVDAYLDGKRLGIGRGESKKEAQQMAAKEALRKLRVL